MMHKNFIVCLLLFIIVGAIFAEPVFAISGMQGFGNYYITENGGKIEVEIRTDANIDDDQKYLLSAFDGLFRKYGRTISWGTGIATIILVVTFVILCVRCAFLASEHWILKRQMMIALLWVGIAAALMGSTTLILALFQSAFTM